MVGETLQDRVVRDLPSLLSPGDVVVANDTRVIPARLFARRGEARIELGLSYRKLERLVDIRVPTLQGWLTGHYRAG